MAIATLDKDVTSAAPAVAPLALADRCDASAVVGGPNGRTSRGACGAQGFIRAVLPSGNDLIFCAHHGREQEAALAAAGATIHDETGKINAEHSPVAGWLKCRTWAPCAARRCGTRVTPS